MHTYWEWWYIPAIPELERQNQGNQEFKRLLNYIGNSASLGYRRPCPKERERGGKGEREAGEGKGCPIISCIEELKQMPLSLIYIALRRSFYLPKVIGIVKRVVMGSIPSIRRDEETPKISPIATNFWSP